MTLTSPTRPAGAPRRATHVASGPVRPTPPPARPLTGTQFLLPLFGFVTLLGVPAALFVGPVLATGQADLGLASLLFAVILVYTAVRLTALMWAAEPRWMVLGLWMFTYCWIGVAGLTQTLADTNPLGLTLPPGLVIEQAALLLFGLICFDVASRLPPTTSSFLAPEAITSHLRGRVLEPRRVMTLGVVSLVLSPLFIVALGGPSALLSSREAVNDTLSDSGLYSDATNAGGGLLITVGGATPFIALLCLAAVLRDDPVFRRRPAPWALTVALLGVNVLINNPISNARYWAFAVILAVLFTWRGSQRPVVLGAFVVAFSLSALTVFPYLDQFRYSESSQQQYDLQVNDFDRAVDYVLAKTDYASVTDVGVALRYVDHEGHTDGRQLLGTVMFWVPRTVWPDKPDNTAFLIADEIGFPNRNLDSPLWAEGYVDFGWFGTALMLGGFGLLARRGDDAFVALCRARDRAVPLAAVAIPVVAGYEYILLRGSLLQAMARIVVMLGILAVVSHVPRTAAPDPAPASGSGRHRPRGVRA